jgi:putative methylase
MAVPPVIRKKKDLEIFLEKVPKFTSPDAKSEQYKTPATIAADIIFNAYIEGDIQDKQVVDLGCGTGIFAIGAKVMGARKVLGVDLDGGSIKLAKQFADENELEIGFEVIDVKDCKWSCDTVIQNPPFGAQNRNADRIFLERAAKLGKVIYSIHNANTVDFVKILIEKLNCSITFEKNYIFKLEHSFAFHTKPYKNISVALFRIVSEH